MKFLRSLLVLLAAAFAANAQQAGSRYNIVFVGNSITYGATLKSPATECPPFHAVALLRRQHPALRYANCGHSGSTTVDFLPASQKLFPKVLEAADSLYERNGWLIFSMTLGTNDSAIEGPNGSPVSAEDYRKNLALIIDSLHRRFPRSVFVLQRPIWYSPTTYNSSRYLEEGLQRLQTYTPEQDKLVKAHPQYIFKGDRAAFAFFKAHPQEYFTTEQGRAGVFYLHPNAAGAEKLGGYWAASLQSVIGSLDRSSARK